MLLYLDKVFWYSIVWNPKSVKGGIFKLKFDILLFLDFKCWFTSPSDSPPLLTSLLHCIAYCIVLHINTTVAEFCESKFTKSRDREWDFSRKFLRVENESSRWKIESWEWEWEFWGGNEIEIENETPNFQEWGSD